MAQPNELLRLKFQNNLLRTELLGKQMQAQLDNGLRELQKERKQLLDEMRKDAEAGPADIYNTVTEMFEPKKE